MTPLRLIVLCLALGIAALSAAALERLRAEGGLARGMIGDTPVTVYGDGTSGLTVLVAHGFAGSRQMMEAISLTLARAGHRVVAFDYLGHGRHAGLLSPDVTRITGTTQDLVDQTLALAPDGPVALVGHSMATDVAIRAAAALEDVRGVAVISMYSEAVTPRFPQRLLIVSGAQEGRLRAVALEAGRQVAPMQEGETVAQGDIARRVVVAPLVGHVGVLWSGTTSAEIAAWLGAEAAPVRTGPWIAALLGALVLAFWPLAGFLPQAAPQSTPGLRQAIGAAIAGALAAGAAGLSGLPMLGLAGFGGLALAMVAFGLVALIILQPGDPRRGWGAGAALLVWGLVFALALDRYGAAFVPTGPRLDLMQWLLAPAMLFALADRALVAGRGTLARAALRVPLLGALLGVMVMEAGTMGLLFTVLPVLVLFWAVYGSMARWVEARAGWGAPALGLGVILAWSIAASTPLFAAP
ncbi:MAG: alpha/beta fold hydrolase [Pseudomonadota bacterium]